MSDTNQSNGIKIVKFDVFGPITIETAPNGEVRVNGALVEATRAKDDRNDGHHDGVDDHADQPGMTP
jgi:hypothetical protein